MAGNSGISQARTRLGWEPVRQLYEEVVQPIAQPSTRGAWYREWRIVSLDGSTLDVADEVANAEIFGRPSGGRGDGAFPQIRFVALLENGTHVLFGGQMAGYATSETTLAKAVLPCLRPGMLCLADRGFYGFALWTQAVTTGAMLLWRVRKDILLPDQKRRRIPSLSGDKVSGTAAPVVKRLPDGSYLSRIYPSQPDQKRGTNGIVVRVIEYRLEGIEGSEPVYRLITTMLNHEEAPAAETGRALPRPLGDRNHFR